MIYFNTEKQVIYNKIIHNYLDIEVFDDQEDDIGDNIEIYMPKYLFREQYQKCIEVFKDLYAWTNDQFIHELTAFHEVALYHFLIEMSNIRDDLKDNFKNIYYDKKIINEINNEIKKDLEQIKSEEFDDEYSIYYVEEEYYDPSSICEIIFEEFDFLEIAHLYNERKANIPVLAELLGINLDYYFEILPIDIQKQYKTNHITLTGEVGELFNYLQHRINSGSLSDLFWEQGNQISEKKIQTILENLMDAYFIGKGIDISREVLIKNGQIDFKLFRSEEKNEKILIEIKKANSSYLKAGYEKQLCEYIEYSGCNNAFYLIVCFTDKEYKVATDFIKNHVYTDTYQMYINIALLDVRKKLSPSKKKKI